MLESGFTWLPAYLWRLHKFWRGIRMETPWVDRAPLEIVRSNIRFSLQPVDAPPDRETLNRLFDHMQSDELLLFSTDYPHWQFDGDVGAAGGHVGRPGAQDHDRQSARDLSPPEANRGARRRQRHEHAVPARRPADASEQRQDRDRRLRHPSGAQERRRISIPGWPSAGTSISKPTASIPIRA